MQIQEKSTQGGALFHVYFFSVKKELQTTLQTWHNSAKINNDRNSLTLLVPLPMINNPFSSSFLQDMKTFDIRRNAAAHNPLQLRNQFCF